METVVRLYSRTLQIVEVILKVYVLTHSHAFACHSRCQVRPTCNNRYVEKLWVVFVMLYRPVSMKKKEKEREKVLKSRVEGERGGNYVCMYFTVDVKTTYVGETKRRGGEGKRRHQYVSDGWMELCKRSFMIKDTKSWGNQGIWMGRLRGEG